MRMILQSFSASTEMLERLSKAKKETGMPMSEIIRRALDAWLNEKGF